MLIAAFIFQLFYRELAVLLILYLLYDVQNVLNKFLYRSVRCLTICGLVHIAIFQSCSQFIFITLLSSRWLFKDHDKKEMGNSFLCF